MFGYVRPLTSRADHAEDPGNIGPICQHLQIEHQLDVFFERRRYVHRTLGQFDSLLALCLGILNALLDLTN